MPVYAAAHIFCVPLRRLLLRPAGDARPRSAGESGYGGQGAGRSSTDLVQEVYGAPRNRAEPCGTVRHRAEEVEYRVGQHREVLEDRLEALQ
jgi:hypothetical protein